MGGLVIKEVYTSVIGIALIPFLNLTEPQALRRAAAGNSPDDKAILHSCVGLVMFGVPNRGLEGLNLQTLVHGQKNSKLISDLEEGSALLRHIDETFRNSFKYADCPIISCFETQDSPTVRVSSFVLWVIMGRLMRWGREMKTAATKGMDHQSA
jgi:hypothetical protein